MATTLSQKIGAMLRSLKREIVGESSRVPLVPEEYIPLRFFKAYADMYRRVSSAPTLENRLEFAQGRPVISGDAKDVHNVRCFDRLVNQLIKSFNKEAAILSTPEKWIGNEKTLDMLNSKATRVINKLNKHSKDLAASFARVTAVTTGADGVQKPVKELAYAYGGNNPFFSVKLG